MDAVERAKCILMSPSKVAEQIRQAEQAAREDERAKYEHLADIQKRVEEHGLVLTAIREGYVVLAPDALCIERERVLEESAGWHDMWALDFDDDVHLRRLHEKCATFFRALKDKS